MPIRWYIPKCRGQSALGDFFSLCNARLRFSKEAYEKYFKNMEYLEVGYEESDNCIFLRPNTTTGFKVGEKDTRVPAIKWKGFTSAYSIHFDKTISVRVQIHPSSENLYFLDLKSCQRGAK